MLGRLLNLPKRLLSKIKGKVSPPPAPTPAPRPAPAPAPPRRGNYAAMHEDEEDSHGGGGHSHSHGHSHGHSHDHGRAEAPSAVDVTPEQTPNPNAMKFTVSKKVSDKGSFSFNAASEAAAHPLGRALFAVAGVKGVFGVNNFVTVTKEDDVPWDRLLGPVGDAIKTNVG